MVREIKYRDVERFLRDRGWSIKRISRSHEIWTSEDGTGRLSIPSHGGKVSPGVVRQIIREIPSAPNEWR